MITKEQKDIALWAKQFAIDNGCQDVRITFVTGTNNSFEYRNTQLDKLDRSTENKLYIELFIDNKYGVCSTNRLDRDELATFITEGINSTKYLAEDPARKLPDSNRYYEGNIDLDQYDPMFDTISPEEKIAVAQKAVEEIYGTNDNIISISAGYDDGKSASFITTSNGFEAESLDSAYSLSVEVALKTDGDARIESYWFDSTIYWDDLKKKGLGAIAMQRALRKIGQQKVASGKYDMLLDNLSSSRLLYPLISAMYGSSIQQKSSFLIDKLDVQIVSNKLTLHDIPHKKRVFGSRLFDGEGVATQERVLIEEGVLKTYFIDTYNSTKLNVLPTVASPSGLSVKMGTKDHENLIIQIDKGIWVTGFNGGNTNPTTGDFSFGVEGFLIEKGKVTQAISEMNITGNILALWNNLLEVGNDPRENTSNQIPSLLFKDVNFSGL